MSYSKDKFVKGDTAEVILLAELVMRGYSVSIPIGHDNLYDIVVEGRSGRLYKVQVKNIQTLRRQNCAQVSCIRKYIGKIDYLAVLILDTWYFFDDRFLDKNSNKLNFHINVKRSHVNRRENFDVFL